MSHKYTNYSAVQEFHRQGHEIGVFSITSKASSERRPLIDLRKYDSRIFTDPYKHGVQRYSEWISINWDFFKTREWANSSICFTEIKV